MNIELHNFFPTPVMVADFKRDFSTEEKEFFKKQVEGTLKYNGKFKNKNSISENLNILDDPLMENLKYDILEMLYMFIKSIYRPSTEVLPYITQSWITVTKEGEYHHIHNHPNSYISGTLYIDADEEVDQIGFVKPNLYNSIRLSTDEPNSYTKHNEFISAKSGRIILFPSYVEHFVPAKVGNNIRTTLTFNSFLKGNLGSAAALTELIL